MASRLAMKYPDQDGNDARHHRRTEKQRLDRQARDTRMARRILLERIADDPPRDDDLPPPRVD